MHSRENYTATMAKIYADQGYLRKAAQIYGHLLKKEPGREDLRRALVQIENRIDQQSGPSRKELGLLIKEWATLMKRAKEEKR